MIRKETTISASSSTSSSNSSPSVTPPPLLLQFQRLRGLVLIPCLFKNHQQQQVPLTDRSNSSGGGIDTYLYLLFALRSVPRGSFCTSVLARDTNTQNSGVLGEQNSSSCLWRRRRRKVQKPFSGLAFSLHFLVPFAFSRVGRSVVGFFQLWMETGDWSPAAQSSSSSLRHDRVFIGISCARDL